MTDVTENLDARRSLYFQSIQKKADIRSAKPEYRIILDTLQETSPINVQDLLVEINETCGFELFTYNALWNHIKTLKGIGAVKQNAITKDISIDQEQITTEIRYLPLSNYAVTVFGLTVLWMLYNMYQGENVIQSVSLVLIGLCYMVAQLLGSEFKIAAISTFIQQIKTNTQDFHKCERRPRIRNNLKNISGKSPEKIVQLIAPTT